VQLVIRGPRNPGFDANPLRRALERTAGLVLIERDQTRQEFADTIEASDAALLSYRKITGSAALLSALGFGRGVIASDLAYFGEILEAEPDAGILVPSRETDDWAVRSKPTRPAPPTGQSATTRTPPRHPVPH
jgi:hypothetical protein